MFNLKFCLATLVGSTLTCVCIASSCGPIDNVELTFYGWHDNDPPSPDNAFDCGRGNGPDGNPIAGGSGSYSDPISFATATDNNNFARCGIVYVPTLRKYFRNEDDCAECKSDWDGSHKYHIDLWTGSNKADGGDELVSCENGLPGGSNTIINNAPDGLPVDATPLFDGNTCYKTTYPVDNPSGLCSGGGSSVPDNSTTTDGYSTTLFTMTSSTRSRPSTSREATESTSATCAWAGHCKGARCKTENDCSDVLVCGPQQTCVLP